MHSRIQEVVIKVWNKSISAQTSNKNYRYNTGIIARKLQVSFTVEESLGELLVQGHFLIQSGCVFLLARAIPKSKNVLLST